MRYTRADIISDLVSQAEHYLEEAITIKVIEERRNDIPSIDTMEINYEELILNINYTCYIDNLDYEIVSDETIAPYLNISREVTAMLKKRRNIIDKIIKYNINYARSLEEEFS